jgi:hypothetical protein
MPFVSTATVSGSKTVTTSVSPALTANLLTGLMATPVEQLTIAQLDQLKDATKRIVGGGNPAAVIGALLV